MLGAIANATKRLNLMTAVTCPIMRYHPAIIAQAAATMALLSDGRFTLGLGTGERLNEHVIGAGWPGVIERRHRLSEALDIINGLLTGKLTQYRGDYFQLDHARLFDWPDQPPTVAVAAAGKKAAELAARKADALVVTEPQAEIAKAYRAAGGRGPRYAEIALCYAKREQDALQTAHHYFRWSALGGPPMVDLPSTEAFAAASKPVPVDAIGKEISCGPSAERHLEAINRYIDAGYDHLILVQIGPDQEGFCRFFERDLAPRLQQLVAA